MSKSTTHSPGLYQQIYSLVCQIPHGKVTTYGQLAALAGCTPRQVGYALAALVRDDVPWHRVLNRDGKISPRSTGKESSEQRDMLEAEGIRFDEAGRIDLSTTNWPEP